MTKMFSAANTLFTAADGLQRIIILDSKWPFDTT